MPYNNVVSRTDAAALIPEEVANDMLRRATDDSAALSLFKRVPVGRAQVRFPILSALPVAYFVNGDTGVKQTTEVNWTNKFLNIEEIAAIMPVPDNVVADVEANIWDESMPYLVEAFYRTLDAAIFFGTNAPGSWPTNVSAAASAAGNTFTEAATAAQGGEFGDIDSALALLDADGFDPTGIVASTTLKGKLRAARSTQGERLDQMRTGGTLNQLDDMPIVYPMRGLFPSGGGAGTNVRALIGDWSQFVLGVRSDISVKVLTEAVITDAAGLVIYNLPQQDMTAIRLTFRIGWQVSNLINYDQAVEANRYPVVRLMY